MVTTIVCSIISLFVGVLVGVTFMCCLMINREENKTDKE